MMQPLMNIIGCIAYVAVCVFGSLLAMNGTIAFGAIVSFILYVRLFTSPLTQMAQSMTNMQTASASAHRIFDFLESEEMPDESEKTTVPTNVRGAAGFERVCFSSPDPPRIGSIKDFPSKHTPVKCSLSPDRPALKRRRCSAVRYGFAGYPALRGDDSGGPRL